MSSRKPRHQRASIEYGFSDGSKEAISLIDQTADLIIQFAWMARSDDPALRVAGKEKIKMVAEFCVAGQFYLADQRPKASKPRGTIETDEGRTSSTAIIKGLADEHDALGDYLKPADLWPRYVAALDELHLSPIEDKLSVTFEGGRTTKDSFRSMLSRQRNKKNKSET